MATFEAPSQEELERRAALGMVDLDGDNDLDIVSVESLSSDKIVYFENLGPHGESGFIH